MWEETMRKASSATGLAVACLLSTVSIALAADPGTEDPNNWPQYNRTANAWRYSPLDQINKDNIGKLSVAWIAHGGESVVKPLVCNYTLPSATNRHPCSTNLTMSGRTSLFQMIGRPREITLC